MEPMPYATSIQRIAAYPGAYGFAPPVPMQVLGEAKGRIDSPDERARKFSQALFPRTTNQYGGVTLPSYHCYVEAGLPKTQVLLGAMGSHDAPCWTMWSLRSITAGTMGGITKSKTSKTACFPPHALPPHRTH